MSHVRRYFELRYTSIERKGYKNSVYLKTSRKGWIRERNSGETAEFHLGNAQKRGTNFHTVLRITIPGVINICHSFPKSRSFFPSQAFSILRYYCCRCCTFCRSDRYIIIRRAFTIGRISALTEEKKSDATPFLLLLLLLAQGWEERQNRRNASLL